MQLMTNMTICRIATWAEFPVAHLAKLKRRRELIGCSARSNQTAEAAVGRACDAIVLSRRTGLSTTKEHADETHTVRSDCRGTRDLPCGTRDREKRSRWNHERNKPDHDHGNSKHR